MLSSGLFTAALLVWPAALVPQPTWMAPLRPPLHVVNAFRPPAARWAAGHRGVDLAGVPGETVRSAGAGRVSFAGRLAGREVLVVVHGSLRTTYEPVAASVSVGAQIGAGDPVGVLQPGHNPAHPGWSVLHWGLLRAEVYLDPMSLLSSAKPVRLLPRWGSMAADSAPRSVMRAAGGAAAGLSTTAPRRRGEGHPLATGALALGAGALAAAAVSRRPP